MTVKWNGAELMARARRGANAGVAEAIGVVEAKAVSLILDTPKSGRLYRRRGTVHQASAPGEPPASDTGTLVNRRHIDLFPSRLAARLTFSSEHALYLELGTRDMEPRPFAERSLRETEGQIRSIILGRVAEAIR